MRMQFLAGGQRHRRRLVVAVADDARSRDDDLLESGGIGVGPRVGNGGLRDRGLEPHVNMAATVPATHAGGVETAPSEQIEILPMLPLADLELEARNLCLLDMHEIVDKLSAKPGAITGIFFEGRQSRFERAW